MAPGPQLGARLARFSSYHINGLPEPVFENMKNEFVVILYNVGKRLTMVAEESSRCYHKKDSDQLMEFCSEPRTKAEIAEFLGVKTIFYVMSQYIKPLLENGGLAMTIPEKPKSKLQKYYAKKGMK